MSYILVVIPNICSRVEYQFIQKLVENIVVSTLLVAGEEYFVLGHELRIFVWLV